MLSQCVLLQPLPCCHLQQSKQPKLLIQWNNLQELQIIPTQTKKPNTDTKVTLTLPPILMEWALPLKSNNAHRHLLKPSLAANHVPVKATSWEILALQQTVRSMQQVPIMKTMTQRPRSTNEYLVKKRKKNENRFITFSDLKDLYIPAYVSSGAFFIWVVKNETKE